jgi:hypothetical protein
VYELIERWKYVGGYGSAKLAQKMMQVNNDVLAETLKFFCYVQTKTRYF